MPRLYIDRREMSPIPPDLTSLEEAIRHIESRHLPPRAVIRQVQIDGNPLHPDNPSDCRPDRLRDCQMIEIFTGTLSEVAMDSIREADTYLARVEEATPSLASSFRHSLGPEALENLKQLYEGFYWLNLLLDRLSQSFEFSLDAIQLTGASGGEHHRNLIAMLKAVIKAHECADYGLVADLLEYEMLPLIPACRSIFAAVRERILSDPS